MDKNLKMMEISTKIREQLKESENHKFDKRENRLFIITSPNINIEKLFQEENVPLEFNEIIQNAIGSMQLSMFAVMSLGYKIKIKAVDWINILDNENIDGSYGFFILIYEAELIK